MEEQPKKTFSEKFKEEINLELKELKEQPLKIIGIFLLHIIIYFVVIMSVLYLVSRPYTCTADNSTQYKIEGIKTFSKVCEKICTDPYTKGQYAYDYDTRDISLYNFYHI